MPQTPFAIKLRERAVRKLYETLEYTTRAIELARSNDIFLKQDICTEGFYNDCSCRRYVTTGLDQRTPYNFRTWTLSRDWTGQLLLCEQGKVVLNDDGDLDVIDSGTFCFGIAHPNGVDEVAQIFGIQTLNDRDRVSLDLIVNAVDSLRAITKQYERYAPT